MKILIADDDSQLSAILVDSLKKQKHFVDTVLDGELAWNSIETTPYDLLILDVRMPKIDGVELCQKVRNYGYQVPVMMLTSLDEREDKILGLDSGADDYVVKPFDLPELMARVRALLRRQSVVPMLQWNNIVIDPKSCEVTYSGKPLKLTVREYNLMEMFLRNVKQTFSRDAILDHLWKMEDPPNKGAVRTLINRLRAKLVKMGAKADIIETVYGIGYRLRSGK